MNSATDRPSLQPYRPRFFADLRRFGNRCDGGYVIPRFVIDASDVLLSLGVEADWSFEEAIHATKPSLQITCVDGTTGPKAIRLKIRTDLLRAIKQLRPRKFIRVIRAWRKPAQFLEFFSRHEFLPLMVTPTTCTGGITLAELLARVRAGNTSRWVFVKMDIEGSEYDVLRASADVLDRISGFVIEFHDLSSNWTRFQDSMAMLDRAFYVAHVHGNNNDECIPQTRVPMTLEITLVNKALSPPAPLPSDAVYPVAGLDYPNRPRRPDLSLRFD